MAEWQEEHGHPFVFCTEATLNLGERPELLALMQRAGFDMVFLGIETPSAASLAETGKRINRVGRIAEELPEVRSLALDPVLASPEGAFVTGARVVLGPPPTRDDAGPRRLS